MGGNICWGIFSRILKSSFDPLQCLLQALWFCSRARERSCQETKDGHFSVISPTVSVDLPSFNHGYSKASVIRFMLLFHMAGYANPSWIYSMQHTPEKKQRRVYIKLKFRLLPPGIYRWYSYMSETQRNGRCPICAPLWKLFFKL